MTWRDELRPATFRGVRFFVSVADTRQQLHSDEHLFPQRTSATEAIAVDSLGIGPRRYQITAFLAGEDYMERRDALESALAEPGSGRLVHPWRGERTVAIVGEIVTRESKDEGGYCSVTFNCVDVSESGLRSEVDTAALADRDLDAFLEETAIDFDATSAALDAPSAYTGPVSDAWTSAQEALEEAHAAVAQGLGAVDDFTARVESFTGAITDFADDPAAAASALLGAIQAVADLPGEVIGALERGVATILAAGEVVLRSLEDLFVFGENAPPMLTTTQNGIDADALRRGLFRVVRHGAVIGAARALLEVPLGSRAEAARASAALDEAFEGLLADPDGPGGISLAGAGLYASLSAARVSMLRHLEAVAAELPDVETYTTPVALPALVVAHQIYGDATRAEEIVTRNDPPNPGMIPADTALEVLRG